MVIRWETLPIWVNTLSSVGVISHNAYKFLILDNPVAIAESKNTGSTYDSIIIFELKRPMRDDYNMESNPITQLIDLDAVQYRKEHPDLSQIECAKNLGIGTSTLSRWESSYVVSETGKKNLKDMYSFPLFCPYESS